MPNTFVIPKQTLPYLAGRKLHAMKMRDGFEDRSWADYFMYLARKDDITLHANPETAIQAGTQELFAMWMDNFAENLPFIRREHHVISELAAPATDAPLHSAIVIGRGPSIFNHKHLEMLAAAKHLGEYTGLVVASDGMLLECLQRGIVPDLTVSVDGSPIIKKWYDDHIVQDCDPIKVALPITIHNSVYKTCVDRKCIVYWYLPQFDNYYAAESSTRIMRMMTKTPKNPDGLVMFSLGGNAGTASWAFACFVLKCSPVALIGIDFGYPEGTKLVDTPYYSTMIREPVQVKAAYAEVYHPYFKTKAHIDSVFKHYRKAFLIMQNMNPLWYVKAGGTINATEGGTLWGSGVTCMSFSEFLEKFKKKNSGRIDGEGKPSWVSKVEKAKDK